MSNKLTKIMALAALTAAVGAWSSQAQASLTYYLAIDGTPADQSIDFSELTAGNVTLGIYANITGSNAGLRIGGGSLVVTNYDGTTFTAGFTGTTLAAGFDGIDGTPVNLAGSQLGAGYTASAFGGTATNWGGTTADPSGYFYAVSEGGPAAPVFGNTVKLGTATFNVGDMEAGKTLSLNFEIRNRPTAPDQLWFEEYTAPVSPSIVPGGALTDQTLLPVPSVIGVGAAFTITNESTPGPVVFDTDVVLPIATGTRQTPATTKEYQAGFSFTNTGSLDVTNNDVIFHYTETDDGAAVAADLQAKFYASFEDPLVRPFITSSEMGDNRTLIFADYGGTADPVTVNGIDLPDSRIVLAKYTYVGDITLDGIVDDYDYGIVVNNFGLTGAGYFDGDLTGDGTVDDYDYGILVNNFGLGTGGANGLPLSAPVPEPASLGLLALGAVALLRSRRRA